jgi:hypothetical protein
VVDVATEEEIAQYEGEKKVIELKEAAKDLVGSIGKKVEAEVATLLSQNRGVGEVVSDVSKQLRKVAQWLRS